ncbi:unnamed protein product [Fusarium venenatum]|uniref:Uncharacterized protein n=1 Tax=Fusarium venenatum TaxID=56646 RepID=A0A2L2U2I0_9HYPO|nr:uncharacterized protein FVRRES_09877 [Fusarium venenatum]CEI69800.1 unnamed protein product [Fusarium venenatum]
MTEAHRKTSRDMSQAVRLFVNRANRALQIGDVHDAILLIIHVVLAAKGDVDDNQDLNRQTYTIHEMQPNE